MRLGGESRQATYKSRILRELRERGKEAYALRLDIIVLHENCAGVPELASEAEGGKIAKRGSHTRHASEEEEDELPRG